jgi:hypothetical protein
MTARRHGHPPWDQTLAPNDRIRIKFSAGRAPWSMADGMIRLHPSASRNGGAALVIIPEPECPARGSGFTDRYTQTIEIASDLRRQS